jgi:hypothetical protein
MPKKTGNYPYSPPMSNIEKVTTFMADDIVRQAWVMDAIHKQAKLVLDHRKELRENMRNGIISAEAWIQVAEEWEVFYKKVTK